MRPKLEEAGIKLFLTSIGPAPRGLEFAELTQYPAEALLADPDNVCYDALGFKNNTFDAFLNYKTPLSLLKRVRKDGAKVLWEALKSWKPWVVNLGQAQQQGGCIIFDGTECAWKHYDEATGAHVDVDEVLARACDM